ncbi:MAG: hypothetical protein Kow0010_19180 [Dehalococcoidia bacterium]
MEFLGIGYQEILLILVLLLVVVGPSRLPTVAYQLGRAVRTLQGYARVVRDEFSEEIAYLQEEAEAVREELQSAKSELREADDELRREQAKFSQEIARTSGEVKRDVSTSLNEGNVVPLRREDGPRPGATTPRGEAAGSERPPAPPLVF